MRALSLLLVVVVAFLAVRWFRVPPAAAAEDGTPPSEAGVRFLEPPETPKPADQDPAQTSETAPSEPAAPQSSWPTNLSSDAGLGDGEEVQVAAALVHGTPAEVQAVAAAFSRDRALLLESFSWAAAG